jgi:phage shock protein C
MDSKRVTRSRTDRLISGVCGGIARYFGFDSVIVRGIFVVVALINPGIAAIAYLVAVFLLPEEAEVGAANQPHVGWRFDPWTGESLHAHSTAPDSGASQMVPVATAPESSPPAAWADAGEPTTTAEDEAPKPRRSRKKSDDNASS